MFRTLLELASSLFGWLFGRQQQKRDDAIREAGRLDQTTVDQRAAIDAQRRQQESDAAPRQPTDKRLDDGTF